MKNKSIKNNYIPEEIKFDNEFNDIYNLMEYSKQNIFITGKAGAGKTTLLEYFRNNSKNFVILASTGISAIKAKGKTIHSFFFFHQEY